MKILKPKWVSHGHPKDEKIESCAIFSVDIHPDGSRFATGGQGEDSGRVVIWNMAPILSDAKEIDSRVPQMLCTLDNHLACVNAVRWSHTGRYLASGGDDKLIMIWTISKSQVSSIFGGGKAKVNIEHWKCSFTLHGHTGDVLDIAWSPQDMWLATASVDNNIIIWNVERFPEIVTILKGHTGLVKGVTWDPVGKYLSSQGDDRSLRVWRTVDWQSEAVIEEPFKSCGGSTIMLRCAWSPDGQYIVSAHSLNNGGPTAQVIERDGWACDKDYVGHRKAVTAVRFIPNLVKRKCGLGSHQKTRHLSVLAIGSRDHGVSVWLGGYPRPLVVMEDLFSAAVLDLAWSPNGLALLACSYDGTLACFLFTQAEIGTPISGSERNELYEKMYGTCVKMSSSNVGAGGGRNLLIENCELLSEADVKSVALKSELAINENSPIKDLDKKCPEPPNATPLMDISRESVPDEVLENGVLVRTSSSSCHSKLYPSPTRKQIETRTADGRRRITPIHIPPTPDSCDGPAPFGSEPVLQTDDRKTKFSSTTSSNIVIERRTETATPTSNNTGREFVTSTPSKDSTPQVGSKRLKRPSDCESPEQAVKYKRICTGSKEPVQVMTVSKVCRVERSEIVTVVKGDAGGISLPALSIKSLQEFNIPPGGLLIVDNKAFNLPKGTIVSVKFIKNSSAVWEHVFGYKILGVSTSDKLVALTLLDTSLYVIDIQRGTFKTPVLYMGALASHLVLNNAGYLMVITNIGECSVWNVNTHTAIVSHASLAPLFSQCSLDKKNSESNAIRIKYGTLSDSGIPMLALTNGKAFVYSLAFACWSLVVDNTSGVAKNISQQIKLSHQSRSVLPLNTLHANCQNNSRSLSIHNTEVSPLCTQSVLESQLSSCITLNSSIEYRQWLLIAVNYYLQTGSEHRLRALCQDLLGPGHGYAGLSTTWESKILGLDKHALLDEVLTEVGKSIHCQRLYTEYRDQLIHLQAKAKSSADKLAETGMRYTKPVYRRSYSANIASIAGNADDPSCRSYPVNVLEKNSPCVSADKIRSAEQGAEKVSSDSDSLKTHPENVASKLTTEHISNKITQPETVTPSLVENSETAMDVDIVAAEGTKCGSVILNNVEKLAGEVENKGTLNMNKADSPKGTKSSTAVPQGYTQRSLEISGKQINNDDLTRKSDGPSEITPINKPNNEYIKSSLSKTEESMRLESKELITQGKSGSETSETVVKSESIGSETNTVVNAQTGRSNSNIKDNEVKTTEGNTYVGDIIIVQENTKSTTPSKSENKPITSETNVKSKSDPLESKHLDESSVGKLKASSVKSNPTVRDSTKNVSSSTQKTEEKSNVQSVNTSSGSQNVTENKPIPSSGADTSLKTPTNISQVLSTNLILSSNPVEVLDTSKVAATLAKTTTTPKSSQMLLPESKPPGVSTLRTPEPVISQSTEPSPKPVEPSVKTSESNLKPAQPFPLSSITKTDKPTPVSLKNSVQVSKLAPQPSNGKTIISTVRPAPASVKQSLPAPASVKQSRPVTLKPSSPAPASVKQSLGLSKPIGSMVLPQSPNVQASNTSVASQKSQLSPAQPSTKPS